MDPSTSPNWPYPEKRPISGRSSVLVSGPDTMAGSSGPFGAGAVAGRPEQLEDLFAKGSTSVPSPEQAALLTATERLRQELAGFTAPFDLPRAAEAVQERDDALDRLDTFVLPRLRRLDAPLLVVIGGSAGSGKSTLTNSLVGVRVSPEGTLRPTTRTPVLAHHPRDAGAFLSRRVLPGLTRTTTTGAQPSEPSEAVSPRDSSARSSVAENPGSGDPLSVGVGSGAIHLVPHWAITPGLAIIDSPDLNSRAEGNRELARQLFGVADLWVFVATVTDYANAAPWEMLAEAVERKVSVAVVLNRVRDDEASDVRHHFATMLRDSGLASAAFFTLPESVLEGGLMPSWRMVALHTWLSKQVGDAKVRDGHVRRAVIGTLEYVERRCQVLGAAARVQADVEAQLRQDLHAVFGPARERLHRRAEDGSVISPAVEVAWRELVGGDQSSRGGRRRGWPGGGDSFQRPGVDAVADGLQATALGLVQAEVQAALSRLADRWHGMPAVTGLATQAQPFAVPDDFVERVKAILLRWEQRVMTRVLAARSGPVMGGDQGQLPEARGRVPVGVAVLTLAVGAEAGWIGPPARALAETGLNRWEVHDQTQLARQELRQVLDAVLALAGERPTALLDELGTGTQRPQALTEAMAQIRQALAVSP